MIEFKKIKIRNNVLVIILLNENSSILCEGFKNLDLREYNVHQLVFETENFVNEFKIKDVWRMG